MISIIAVIGQNRALGKNNQLLWRLPQDLKRFKKITFGHPVIMGRVTYESLGKPLPGRINIIVTRNKDFKAPGCLVFDSLEKAVNFAKNKDKEVFIIGGGQIYEQGIRTAEKLYLTIVDDSPEADTFFPDYRDFKKKVFQSEPQQENGYTYYFLELIKNRT